MFAYSSDGITLKQYLKSCNVKFFFAFQIQKNIYSRKCGNIPISCKIIPETNISNHSNPCSFMKTRMFFYWNKMLIPMLMWLFDLMNCKICLKFYICNFNHCSLPKLYIFLFTSSFIRLISRCSNYTLHSSILPYYDISVIFSMLTSSESQSLKL